MKSLFGPALLMISCSRQVNAADPGYNGRLELLGAGKIPYVWEQPLGKAKGLLFLFHGCQHSALDFWPSSEGCEKCVGLPEEHKIAKTAVESGYFTVAISSHSQDHGGCWAARQDNARFLKVIKKLKSEESLKRQPVFLLGISSGGGFASQLPGVLDQLAGLCNIVGFQDISFLIKNTKYPPSQWIYMSRDEFMTGQVKEIAHGLTAAGHKHEVIEVKPKPLTETFLSSRIENFDKELSRKIFEKLAAAKYLRPDGTIHGDPRLSDWRKFFEPFMSEIAPDTLVRDKSPIAEEMNVAYGFHEAVADHMDQTIKFFDAIAETWHDNSHAAEHI